MILWICCFLIKKMDFQTSYQNIISDLVLRCLGYSLSMNSCVWLSIVMGLGKGNIYGFKNFPTNKLSRLLPMAIQWGKSRGDLIRGGQKTEVVEENSEVSLREVDKYDTHDNHTLINLALLCFGVCADNMMPFTRFCSPWWGTTS